MCFFAPVADPIVLERVEFYAQDLRALDELGWSIQVATRARDLWRHADCYFIWWWTWAFMPLCRAGLARSPSLVTGVFDLRWPGCRGHGDFESRPWWQRRLMTHALARAGVNVFLSDQERRQVVNALAAPRAVTIPLGVDTAFFEPSGITREPFVLTVAWLEGINARRKGVTALIRALPGLLRRHPRVRLVIAGAKGTAFPALEHLATRLGVREAVSFPGVVSRDEKRDLMRRCAVYAQPSVYEGFGLATLEAMSCGAPVVASASGAGPEVVGEAGIVLDDCSPPALADALATLLEDEDLQRQFGAQARGRASEVFPLARRREGLRTVIDALMSSQGSSLRPEPMSPEP